MILKKSLITPLQITHEDVLNRLLPIQSPMFCSSSQELPISEDIGKPKATSKQLFEYLEGFDLFTLKLRMLDYTSENLLKICDLKLLEASFLSTLTISLRHLL